MYVIWCKDQFIPEKLMVKMGNNGRQQRVRGRAGGRVRGRDGQALALGGCVGVVGRCSEWWVGGRDGQGSTLLGALVGGRWLALRQASGALCRAALHNPQHPCATSLHPYTASKRE